MTDEIVALDVETTGLSPNMGHRIILVIGYPLKNWLSLSYHMI